ncbi:hypothetical protein J4211_05475 [Candidatus Woesearchaeota archaeon]|nr:hypothetical protein [Candidatus Woesearchaeota archaeon]
MNISEAIARLTRAMLLVSASDNFDKDEFLGLIEDVIDEKHWSYIQTGLSRNDKTSLLRGLMGALSHYEAEQEKERNDKRLSSFTD